MSGNGWLCDKVRILFWNWPKSSPFFHAGCASCGVLAGGSGASLGENRGGFWEILAADFGQFRSSFRRFCCALGEGGRQWACARVASGVGQRKKGASDSTRAVGCTEKGDHGAEIRRKLALSSSASGCRSPRGRRGRRFSLRGRGQPLSDGAEVEFRGSFLVGKGGRLTGWDDYLWVYSSYSLMYSITRSMASGRMSLMRGLLTQSYTMG